ncbi:MAG: hypothetical protein LBG19_02440 [Prevotellaceae bacterium]|jgi:hypothetical protein|nr:hypothetical protein [Prevotellaceae bacterium]
MEIKHLSSTKLEWAIKERPYKLQSFYKKLIPVDSRYLIIVSNLNECLCFNMVEKKVVWVDMNYHKYNDSYSFTTHEHTFSIMG